MKLPFFPRLRCRRFVCPGAVLLVLGPWLHGAAATPPTALPASRDPAAEAAWQQVLRQIPVETRKPETTEVVTDRTRGSSSVAVSHRAEVASRNQRSADAAKDFYTRYPNHPEAKTARYLEAVGALKNFPSDPPGRARVLNLARDVRRDTAQPIEQRIKVALLMEGAERGRPAVRTPGRGPDTAARERSVDDLRREFGDRPEIYALYSAVLADADRADALRLANKILGLPAPDSAKREARDVIARSRLIGKKTPVRLRDTAGVITNLGAPSGQRTVLYFSGPNDTFVRDERGVRNPTRWINLVVGTPTAAAKPLPRGLQNSATRHVLESGFNAPICVSLHVRETPYVVVIDAQGRVQNYGPGDRLEELLTP